MEMSAFNLLGADVFRCEPSGLPPSAGTGAAAEDSCFVTILGHITEYLPKKRASHPLPVERFHIHLA
jgi:hypothetical protein